MMRVELIVPAVWWEVRVRQYAALRLGPRLGRTVFFLLMRQLNKSFLSAAQGDGRRPINRFQLREEEQRIERLGGRSYVMLKLASQNLILCGPESLSELVTALQ